MVEVEPCLLDDKSLPVNAYPLIKDLCSKYDIDTEYGKCQYVSRLWESKYNGNVNQTVSEIIQHVWDKTKDNSPLFNRFVYKNKYFNTLIILEK